ncbi:glycine C-acetyltransferase [bacterium]|nr:glycine C-acetyltransferase [bacterium]
MAYGKFKDYLLKELSAIRESGMFKDEKVIVSSQSSGIETTDGPTLNFCANNYLGLANHPEIIEAVQEGLRKRGFGMASVRFICGTQDIHKELERKISEFLKTDDTILYSSCFDANGGLFETLLGTEDAIISDALNHASIIDGIRLCKAERKLYQHSNLADLEEKLKETSGARHRMIITDGAFSMHGDLARLPEICSLAEKYDALVAVDDSHATGFFGPTGRGTPEHFDVQDKIDVITSTLGKAMGGATGGFTTGRAEIIAMLRQRSRPYLFSNSVAPPVVYGTLKVFELIQRHPELIRILKENTSYFRSEMTRRGFQIKEGIHPIVPIMLGDEKRTQQMAQEMKNRGIFVVGFSFPVVPRGEARIRVQLSAAHTMAQLDRAIQTFEEVGKLLGVIQ